MLKHIMWILGFVIFCGVIAVLFLGKLREKSKVKKMEDGLLRSKKNMRVKKIDFATFALLPAPVARYFKYVLTDGQPIINLMRMQQTGVLRMNTITDKWVTFTAKQLVVPSAPGFIWRVNLYIRGTTPNFTL